MSRPTDLVQGTLDLLILRVIALEPLHGWAIAQRIRQLSNDQLGVGQGSLYPALHKLEQQGWISAEWRRIRGACGRRSRHSGAAGVAPRSGAGAAARVVLAHSQPRGGTSSS
jgi:Transcriptional regulator PadR-like family